MSAPVPIGPCAYCPSRQDCGEQELACESYERWVATGRINSLPREPNTKLYRRVFGEVAA